VLCIASMSAFCCAGRAATGAAAAGPAPMDANNSSRGGSRAGSANRNTAASDTAPHTPGDNDGAAAASTGKRAKKRAVRSTQRATAAAAAAAPDPVRDEAALKVGAMTCCRLREFPALLWCKAQAVSVFAGAASICLTTAQLVSLPVVAIGALFISWCVICLQCLLGFSPGSSSFVHSHVSAGWSVLIVLGCYLL
jgi:hypothetical protein